MNHVFLVLFWHIAVYYKDEKCNPHKIHRIKSVELELELDSDKQVLLAVASQVISNAIKILTCSLSPTQQSEEVLYGPTSIQVGLEQKTSVL